MTKPLPRSYAALIGGSIRDARVATEGGREQLVIELENGGQYAVTTDQNGIVVSELQPPTVSGTATKSASPASKPAVNLQAVAGAVQDILRDL